MALDWTHEKWTKQVMFRYPRYPKEKQCIQEILSNSTNTTRSLLRTGYPINTVSDEDFSVENYNVPETSFLVISEEFEELKPEFEHSLGTQDILYDTIFSNFFTFFISFLHRNCKEKKYNFFLMKYSL